MISLLRAIVDRLSLYLPIFLMGLLALGTYWLDRSTPVFAPAPVAKAATHDPDYFMKDFVVKSFDAAGRLKSEVVGSVAKHYPDTDLLEIDAARIRSFDDKGQLTTATARRAITNADGSEVQLLGNALVVREAGLGKRPTPRLEFRGEYLQAFTKTEVVKSNQPVVLVRGQDQFTADSMDYDNITQVMLLRGRVKGILMPESQGNTGSAVNGRNP